MAAAFSDPSAPTANVKYQTDKIGSDLGYREWEVINVDGLVGRGGRCRPRLPEFAVVEGLNTVRKMLGLDGPR